VILNCHKLKKFFLLLIIFSFTQFASAQELLCKVDINTQQVSGTDKRIYDNMKTQIYEFLNNRKWTTESFKNEERIECSILINITERLSTDEFNATLQIQTRRPVYESSYNSILLNFVDNDMHFRYTEGQQLEYSENTYLSNLTSILAFYANMVIGLDYDSFSLNGGTPYFQKALAIANNAQGSDERGWKAFDGNRNRYWMINNMLDAPFIALRECMYTYHRKGMDIMAQNSVAGRAVIMESIESLSKVHNIKPLSFSLQLFFNAKVDEIINIFIGAKPEEKTKLMDILGVIDPTNNNKYQKIVSTN
jgi:hypothetical protein